MRPDRKSLTYVTTLTRLAAKVDISHATMLLIWGGILRLTAENGRARLVLGEVGKR